MPLIEELQKAVEDSRSAAASLNEAIQKVREAASEIAEQYGGLEDAVKKSI